MSSQGDANVAWAVGPTFLTGSYGLVRAAVSGLDLSLSLDQRLVVNVPILTEGYGGFPDEAEGLQLGVIRDQLCQSVPTAVLFGTITYDGVRHHNFYVNSVQFDEEHVWQVARRFPLYEFRITHSDEPDHRSYSVLRTAALDADLDRRTVNEFLRTGADPYELHATDYFFLFPTEERALVAVDFFSRDDTTVQVHEVQAGEKWSVRLSVQAYVNFLAVAEDRRTFGGAARRLGGTYDGWGVATSR